MRNILIISPESWGAHTVSKHHYAITLARSGARVYFLNPPVHEAAGFEVNEIEATPGLFTVSARKLAPGLRFLPSVLRRILERRWLERLESALGTAIDVIWVFESSRFYDMRFAGNRLKIYHQVDLNQNFNPRMAASTADICYCTTDLIRERLQSANKLVCKIHHGYSGQQEGVNLKDEQSQNLKKGAVNAAYIGNLDIAYLDADLLYSMAKTFENVNFSFVGGHTREGRLWQLCSQLPNVAWWGKVESSLIPEILSEADILIVAYRAERWRDQLASPHKFMEYFGSGKTIVATYTDEYKDKRHLLEMVDSSEEYIEVFRDVVENLDKYNAPERMASRIEFAMDNTYEKQLLRINNYLTDNNLPAVICDQSIE